MNDGFKWHSVAKDGYPHEKRPVIVTVRDRDGDRWVMTDARYIRDLAAECYTDKYIAEHPNGVWEWAYEAGAGYWEDIPDEVVAWTEKPMPYEGE